MIICGRNACIEALKNEKLTINKAYFLKGDRDSDIVSLARSKGVAFSFVEKEVLTKITNGEKTQGVALDAVEFEYACVSEQIKLIRERGEKCFFVICTEIMDTHNLGAIVRSADFAGVNLVVISKNNSCKVNDTVIKTSAGSVFNIPIAMVSNVAQLIEQLKNENIFVYGAEAGGKDYLKIDFTGDIAIVVGGEDQGIKPIIKKACDEIVEIKNNGKVNSLNASVAAGVIIFEAVRQRNK